MTKVQRISVLGGDKRNIGLVQLLHEDGFDVGTFGLEKVAKQVDLRKDKMQKAVEFADNMVNLLKRSDVVVGPIPLSNDGVFINAPFSNFDISINDILFGLMSGTGEKKKIFIAGKISQEVRNVANACRIRVFDLLNREEMAVLNTIPTAEGAIQMAMEEMETTLHGSNALILGYGRIGKVLSGMLTGIGANVFVTARKAPDFSWINVMRYRGLRLEEVENIASEVDVVFNTIPTRIVNERLLGAFRTNCLLIDLASKPGGIDFDKAKELGMKSIWALSLPGKVAPFSAAKYIRETIFNILNEEQVKEDEDEV